MKSKRVAIETLKVNVKIWMRIGEQKGEDGAWRLYRIVDNGGDGKQKQTLRFDHGVEDAAKGWRGSPLWRA